MRVKSADQAAEDSVEHHCQARTCRSSVTAINKHQEPI